MLVTVRKPHACGVSVVLVGARNELTVPCAVQLAVRLADSLAPVAIEVPDTPSGAPAMAGGRSCGGLERRRPGVMSLRSFPSVLLPASEVIACIPAQRALSSSRRLWTQLGLWPTAWSPTAKRCGRARRSERPWRFRSPQPGLRQSVLPRLAVGDTSTRGRDVSSRRSYGASGHGSSMDLSRASWGRPAGERPVGSGEWCRLIKPSLKGTPFGLPCVGTWWPAKRLDEHDGRPRRRIRSAGTAQPVRC